MLDLSDIKYLRWPTHLGNIEVTTDNAPQNLAEAWEWFDRHNVYVKARKNDKDMYAINAFERYQLPPIVWQVLNAFDEDDWVINDFGKDGKQQQMLVGLIGDGEPGTTNGIDWHKDDGPIMAMNIVGNSEWFFKRPDEHSIKMKPGDCLFIPTGVSHKVIADAQRFTLGFNLRYEGISYKTPDSLQ